MAYHSFNKKYNLVIIGRCMLVCYPTENFWLISKYLTHITRHVEVNLITSTQYCCVCVCGIFCALRGPLKRLRRRHSNRSIVQGATTCVFRISRKKKQDRKNVKFRKWQNFLYFLLLHSRPTMSTITCL